MEAICPVPCLQFRISAFLRNFVPSGAAHEAAAGHALSEPSETHHHHIEYKKPTLWVGLLFLAVIDICDYFNDVLNNEGMFSLKKSSRGNPSGPTMNELTIFFSNFFMNAW